VVSQMTIVPAAVCVLYNFAVYKIVIKCHCSVSHNLLTFFDQLSLYM